jgi:hypothetical protein
MGLGTDSRGTLEYDGEGGGWEDLEKKDII